MEVTRNNFEKLYPEIVKDINSSSFVCIDGEFTGLDNGSQILAFDTPEESYLKIKAGSMDFLFIQFGLSIFTKNDETGNYINKTYTFYLFPWHRSNLTPDPRFLCQTSSINFLVSNNFDFNKLFKEGIPYLNSTDEARYADALETKRAYKARASLQKDSTPQAVIPIPEEHQETVNDAMKKIEGVVEGAEEEVKIGKQTSFVRKLIYQTYEQSDTVWALTAAGAATSVWFGSPEGVLLKSETGGGMVCRRGEVEDQATLDLRELEAAVGFSRLIRHLAHVGCLVVGHNMILDLCHLVHQFVDPLPSDYLAFKEMAHTLFPRVVDTKMISSSGELKDIMGNTTLEALSVTLSKSPFHLPHIEGVEGYSFEGETGQLHSAGYDAYLTGKVFLGLLRALDPDNKNFSLQKCRPLEKFINKLYLMRTPDTCMNLSESDPEPKRDHVFHITFPSFWTNNDISKLFADFGGVELWWLSDTTAWVALRKKDEANKAFRHFQSPATVPSGVSVVPYHRWRRLGNKRKAPPVANLRKKRRSSLKSKSTSPAPEIVPAKIKDADIKVLEEAVSAAAGGEFGGSTDWD